MKDILFSLKGNEDLAKSLAQISGAEVGEAVVRNFPDGETYVKINADVKDKRVIMVCTLDHPDDKLLPLYFLARTAKDLGSKKILLVAPYLAYMRQDKRFKEGEGITSEYFAKLISFFADELITIDPHLHRRTSLSEIYPIPSRTLHAANLVSTWIRRNIDHPVLVGPDSESVQWISEVAGHANAPYLILEKRRKGDRDVEISIPNMNQYKSRTPVLVDDIISTARTMIETIIHIKKAGMQSPVCIGVHGIFAGTAYDDLQMAGAGRIVTCNTILHETNKINVDDLIAKVL